MASNVSNVLIEKFRHIRSGFKRLGDVLFRHSNKQLGAIATIHFICAVYTAMSSLAFWVVYGSYEDGNPALAIQAATGLLSLIMLLACAVIIAKR
jgi:hypothetical protein